MKTGTAVLMAVAVASQGSWAGDCRGNDDRASFGFAITSDGRVGFSYNYDSNPPGVVYYPPPQVVYYPAPQVVYYPLQPVVYCQPRPVVFYAPPRPVYCGRPNDRPPQHQRPPQMQCAHRPAPKPQGRKPAPRPRR